MNSRDAAYEERVQQLLETTAAEAAALNGETASNRAVSVTEEIAEEAMEVGQGGRKKRKRADEELYVFRRSQLRALLIFSPNIWHWAVEYPRRGKGRLRLYQTV